MNTLTDRQKARQLAREKTQEEWSEAEDALASAASSLVRACRGRLPDRIRGTVLSLALQVESLHAVAGLIAEGELVPSEDLEAEEELTEDVAETEEELTQVWPPVVVSSDPESMAFNSKATGLTEVRPSSVVSSSSAPALTESLTRRASLGGGSL